MAVRGACPLWRQETGRSLGVGSKRGSVGGQLWSNTDQHYLATKERRLGKTTKTGQSSERIPAVIHAHLPEQHSSSSNQEAEVNARGQAEWRLGSCVAQMSSSHGTRERRALPLGKCVSFPAAMNVLEKTIVQSHNQTYCSKNTLILTFFFFETSKNH